MEKKLTKGDLDQLTSNIWYSNFERGEECFEHVSFYSEIKDELENTRYWYYGLSKISQNIVRALCYIYNRKINHQNDFDKDRCSYLYYWLGDKIYSRVHDKTKFSSIIKMIYQEIYKTNFLNTCNYRYIDIEEDIFNTYKILHDYSKDYGNIHLNTLSGNMTCDEDYKKAMYKYIDIYNHVYSKCNIERTNKYDCDYFNELFEGYNHDDLSSFHCMQHNVQAFSIDEQAVVEPSRKSLSVTRSSRGTLASVIHPNPKDVFTYDNVKCSFNSFMKILKFNISLLFKYYLHYLSYDCYNYLSEKLDAPKLSKENEVHLENALQFLGKEQYNKYNKYPKHKAIDNLAARITQDGLFYYSHNTKVACNYINYKLNETLRTHYNHIYTEDYNIFKKLVKEFYNKRHNSNNSQKPCENYIEHIDDEIYKKLNILYNIYYHYNELNRPNNYIYNNADHKLCSNLDLLIYYSNDAINRGLINEETISLIRKLKEIINNDDISKPYKQKCDLRVLYIMLTELPKTEVQITREANSELDLHVAQKPDELHELEPQRGDAVNEQASSQQESEDETSRDLAPQELVPQELAAKVEEPGIQLNGFQGVMYPAISQQVSYDQVVTGRPEERYISQDPEAPTREEEEDAHMEFLVVSMDHSQENLQDIKIIWVEILDIVK
ncbi:hypothetical protein PVBG_06280 [Plasmodium vivax Brazil I]|uniref:VIR protein n=1 Tax=Plasmodium vivax (strain Brazil I) TaxID=1033975 RepID=A0A0J9T170_PLAV1|nr:hypothetical protein PVBG_06280 [Plasmodium vivax Brazil I]